MIHFCVFGGHGGQLTADKKLYVTFCGGCEVKRPTLARQIVERMQREKDGLSSRRQHFFITICGATEITAPTLAEEYVDLQEALRAGVIPAEEFDAAMARLSTDESMRLGSFTMCGAFEDNELPDENSEVEGLALNRHLGQIPEEAGKTLELGVRVGGSQRAAVLRQALGTVMRPQLAVTR